MLSKIEVVLIVFWNKHELVLFMLLHFLCSRLFYFCSHPVVLLAKDAHHFQVGGFNPSKTYSSITSQLG